MEESGAGQDLSRDREGGLAEMDLESLLEDNFGLESFRFGQRPVIESVLRRRDVLCVMPTGGGKSLCYQFPALILDGVTLVVSPLIALMKDQVDGLVAKGIRATVINSSLDPAEQYARIRDVEQGRYNLVYVAPERFRSSRFIEAARAVKPALLAVDEAHCISEWGHDFRPDYARLGHARRLLGFPPTIALTATATQQVRDDIVRQLELRDPEIYVTGFDRPNLGYHVLTATRDPEKLNQIIATLKRNPGPAIIYANSRGKCESIGAHIAKETSLKTVVYHAGMERELRTEAQERFMSGGGDVVVATNAFGMGVDKSDIRTVIHFNMPGTIEAYYQEAGRAGRDGKPSECLLLFSYGDRKIQEMFIEQEYPSKDLILRAYDFLRTFDADPIEFTQAEIRERMEIEEGERAVGAALKILERAGAIEQFRPRENMAIIRFNVDPEEPSLLDRLSPQAHSQRLVLAGLEAIVGGRFGEPVYFHPERFAEQLGIDRHALGRALHPLTTHLPIDYVPPFRGNAIRVVDRERKSRDLRIDFRAIDERRQLEYRKLAKMSDYADSKTCRRKYILDYFGEAMSGNCGNCDRCADRGIHRPQASPIHTPQGREVLLKALSGVARAKGRVGKIAIAQMLAGSGSQRMTQLGLANLTTFGILGTFARQEIEQLLDALLISELLEVRTVGNGHPVIQLAEKGWEYIRNPSAEPIGLHLPAELLRKILGPSASLPGSAVSAKSSPTLASSSASASSSSIHADELRLAFKSWRGAQAKAEGVASFMVFSDKILDSIIETRPSTLIELGGIRGMGPTKIDRYGASCLAILKGQEPTIRSPDSNPAPLSQPHPQSPLTQSPTPTPTPTPKPAAEPPSPPIPAASAKTAAPPARPPSRPLPDAAAAKPPISSAPAFAPAPPRELTKPSPSPSPVESKPAAVAPKPAAAIENLAAQRLTAFVQSRPETSMSVTTEEWTWKLLERGFSFQDVMAIRGLEPGVVIRHATWNARAGRAVPLSAFLEADVIQRWDEWRRSQGEDPPPPDASPSLWVLFLTCRKNQPAS